MYARNAGVIARRNIVPSLCVRLGHNSPPDKPDNFYDPNALHEHPVDRCKRFLKRDIDSVVKVISSPFANHEDGNVYPKTVDILIVGGGVIGSSIAYWIQNKCRDGLSIAVVEKDPLVNKTLLSPEEVLQLTNKHKL